MLPDEITITLGDRNGRVSMDALQAALENALEMLRNLETQFTAAGTEVRYEVVKVQMRSPLKVTISPTVRAKSGKRIGRQIVKAFLDGVDAIEHSDSVPQHFNEEALRATKELAEVGQKEGTKVMLGANGKHRITLTVKTIRRVDEVVEKSRRYRDISTIEGALQVISTHQHKSFFIYELLTNNRIECLPPKDADLADFVRLLDKRVAVTGVVKYTNHVPKTIEVEAINPLPDSTVAIKLEHIAPIDITEGRLSEEHVRSMRDA